MSASDQAKKQTASTSTSAKKSTSAKPKATRKSEPTPVDCPNTCAAPATGKQTYTFEVDNFLLAPDDPANDPQICLRVYQKDEVEWKTTKEIRVNHVDAFGGHHGNPFTKALPFLAATGHTNVTSGPLAAGSAPPAGSKKCWLYKANLQVKEGTAWVDKDPHIFTNPGQ